MNSPLHLLKLALKESDSSTWSNLLEICRDSRLFQKESNIQNIISFINYLLNVSNTYTKGLELIEVLLPQCKSDIVGQCLLKWLQVCSKGLQSHSHSVIVYTLLRDLIICSKDYPDVRKQTSLTIIPKIVEHFFKNKRKFTNKILGLYLLCLEEILSNYGKACSNWKNKIEVFLLSQLESSPEIVQACSRCFLKLVAIGPANSTKEDYKQQLLNKQKFLVSVLHSQLDSLFNPLIEIQGTYDTYIIEYDKKCIPEILETSPFKKAQRSTVQLTSLVEFLNEMLLGPIPFCKRINMTAALSVVCRGLSVSGSTLEANITSDTIILSTQIPEIQRACLKILCALIQTCKRNLLSQGKLICKLLTQVLKWTKVDCEYGQSKPYSLLRVDAYNCFNAWLTISRNCSSVEHYINDVLPSLHSDIHSEKPSITLTVSTKRLKGKVGKRERKRNKDLTSTESKMPISINNEANKEICEAALNFIPPFLEASSTEIPPNVHKQLQERIVNELVMIQAAIRFSLDLPIPYSDESCRLALYKALLALCNYHHPKFPAPCNYALHMFFDGLTDDSLMIVRFCGQAVANIQKILMSFGPTQNYPLELGREIPSTTSITSQFNAILPSQPQVQSEHQTQAKITNEVDTCLNNKQNESDSLIFSSPLSLFEIQLRESSNSKTDEIGSNIVQNDQRFSEEIVSEENSVTELHVEDDKQVNQKDGTSEVVLEDIKNNSESSKEKREDTTRIIQTIQQKTPKRLPDDKPDHFPQEKKKKQDISTKVSNKEATELEAEMISSFVDILK